MSRASRAAWTLRTLGAGTAAGGAGQGTAASAGAPTLARPFGLRDEGEEQRREDGDRACGADHAAVPDLGREAREDGQDTQRVRHIHGGEHPSEVRRVDAELEGAGGGDGDDVEQDAAGEHRRERDGQGGPRGEHEERQAGHPERDEQLASRPVLKSGLRDRTTEAIGLAVRSERRATQARASLPDNLNWTAA